MSAPTPLPAEIYRSAQDGELQKVAKWLGKGGLVDALCSALTTIGETSDSDFGLLHGAASNGHLELVRELLKRGASVDLPTGLVNHTALMYAATGGHLSTLLLLLQYSANPDLQSNGGTTALMLAARGGHEACVKALLRAKANTELLNESGDIAQQWAEAKGHTATAALIRQHAAPPPATNASLAVASSAPPDACQCSSAPPDAGEAALHLEIYYSAGRGELHTVVKWLREGGPVDMLCPVLKAE